MTKRIPFFGVDGETGKHAFEPLPLADVDDVFAGHHAGKPGVRVARGRAIERDRAGDGDARAPAPAGADSGDPDSADLVEDIDDLNDLGQTGWAIVFTASVGQDIKDALRPLSEHRERQIAAGLRPQDADKRLFRDDLTIGKGETIGDLRARWGMAPGAFDPSVVPAYILIVGPPGDVSFDVQHDLDVDYFVGRLDLPSVEDYEAYARAVVAAETQPARPNRAVFWGPQNPDDDATQLSCTHLVRPLAEAIGKRTHATVDCLSDKLATKAVLGKLFGDDAPAMVFTGGHGVYLRAGAPEQQALEGALVTQEWPGPLDGKGFSPEHRFAASDLAADTSLGGMIAVLFACFGGGVPLQSRYPYQPGEDRKVLAAFEFTAALPKAMLARGAGAVIAHIDRTWDTGFSWEGVSRPMIDTWINVIGALLKGKRVGCAAAHLNEKFLSVSAELSQHLEQQLTQGQVMSPDERRYLWLQYADARGWVVLGDPAAKIAIRPQAPGA